MADRTATSESTDERTRAAGGSSGGLLEPVVVGAVVGGLANLVNTEVLFPGWGVVAGAAIGLGCGLALRGREERTAPADVEIERPARRTAAAADGDAAAPNDGATAEQADPTTESPATEPPATESPATEPDGDDKGRSGVGGAKARVIARSSTPESEEAPRASAPKVIPKEAIVSARPLAPSTPHLPDDDLVEVTVLGSGSAVTATGRSRGDRVRKLALAEPAGADEERARQWAELLVDGFTASTDPTTTDRAPFGRVLAISRSAWAAAHDVDATSSFLGLEIVDVDGGAAWRAVAAGRSVLLVVRDGDIAARLPSAAGDAADPIPSQRTDGDLLRRSNGSLRSGDVVLVCSGRVADWAGTDGKRIARLMRLDPGLDADVPGEGPVAVARVRVR